jgi:uncharacterized SAM-binding protein YcdF (DUF218 family)
MEKLFRSLTSRAALSRGVALYLAAFCLLNLFGDLRAPGFDANLWWIDLRGLPAAVANLALLVCSLFLFGFAVLPPGSQWRRNATAACSVALAAALLGNSLQFYSLLMKSALRSGFPVPLSLLICIALVGISVVALKGPIMPSKHGEFLGALGICLVCGALFPVLQMFCFGKTDYRRSADIAVVFGARVYADGTPSDALADRIRTACEIYREGYARKLLMSGGRGDGSIDEATAMKNLAVGLGVRPEDIIMDSQGINTQATVRNTERVFEDLKVGRILAVSHFYHLPRIKLAYARVGLEVYTVPAKETRFLGQLPYNMAREVAALWVYYLRPLGSSHQAIATRA